ncbi:MAG: ATP-binding protein [bacterium]|nr:ATP-binding protein [bacterium]
MKTAIEMVLKQNLKELKLSTMFTCLAEHSRQARESQQSYEEFLLGLTETELQIRSEHRLTRRLRDARFPLMKPLEEFQFERAVGLDARQIRDLCGGEYISRHRNVILLGNSGTGKTHLATGLGIEACKQGFRTRFVTGCGLANELLEAREERGLSRMMKRYAGYDLLIVDELGYVPFSKAGAELLFQVLAERHERKSVIVTTNLGFADWTQVFGEANLTAALLDRLTHQAVILKCSWESYRLHQSLRQQVTTPAEGNPAHEERRD